MSTARYHHDWAKHLRANIGSYLAHLAGRPLRYLEIGVFEGRSLLWMMENVLTHADSRAVGIDAWGWNEGSQELARSNLMPHLERIELIRGDSAAVLRDPRFEPETFDLVYVDGCHRALSVLTDSTLIWPLVRLGGHVVWDDYRWRTSRWRRLRHPPQARPKEALDTLLMALRGQHEVLFSNYQLGICKTARAPSPYQDAAAR